MNHQHPIISRAEARAQGLKRFFTGKPCKHGHVEERRVYNKACLACHRNRVHAWARNNKERVAEMTRNSPVQQRTKQAYREEHREEAIQRTRAWREANLEYARERDRAYYRANIDQCTIRIRIRQGHLKTALTTLTPHEQAQVRAIYRARYRLTQDTGIPYHVDHHLPLALGGLHHPENLRLLPGHINDAKGAKHPDEFYAQVGSVLP